MRGAWIEIPTSANVSSKVIVAPPCVGRDIVINAVSVENGKFQSTRPRGARQVVRDSDEGRCRISIHAPAWGATVPVYTGLITAVALYFSRTSFLAVLLQAFFVAKSAV